MIDFPVFWRTEPLSEEEKVLVTELMKAHEASVFRQNASTVNVLNGAIGSGDYTKAIAAGMMTIGGVHAPIWQTMSFLSSESPVDLAGNLIGSGRRVPGWGNSFIKGEKDNLWDKVEAALLNAWDPWSKTLEQVTRKLHEHGKKVYPNPSAFTAATALALDIPPIMAPMLFVTGRLNGWNKLIHQNLVGGVP